MIQFEHFVSKNNKLLILLSGE